MELDVAAPILLASNDDAVKNKKGGIKENAKQFIAELTQIMVDGYFNLLQGLFKKFDNYIERAIFDTKNENVNAGYYYIMFYHLYSILSPDGGAEMQFLLKLLSNTKDHLNNVGLDPRLINNAFENIAMYIDAYIFNMFIKNASVNAGRALQVKMSVSFLENWFEDNAIKFVQDLSPDANAHTFFPCSRQSADVCVIAQKSLLTGTLFLC